MSATTRVPLLGVVVVAVILVAGIGTATPAAANQALLIGMGDSYSTGAGIPPTEIGAGGCERSARAYSMVTAELLGFDGQNVACGRAVLADITSTSSSGSPLQTTGIAAADFVAFTMGGNDVGGPRGILEAARTEASRAKFAADVDALLPRLVTAYTEVARAAPSAEIFVLGYPDIMPQTQQALDACLGARVAGLAAANIHHNIELLNSAIADAAAAAGSVFVDTTWTFAGHEMCTEEPFANAPDDPAPAYPGTQMHPNELGHLAMAADLMIAIVLAALGDLSPQD